MTGRPRSASSRSTGARRPAGHGGPTILRHARLVLPDRVVDDGWLQVADGQIVGVGAEDDTDGAKARHRHRPDGGRADGDVAYREDANRYEADRVDADRVEVDRPEVDLGGRWVLPGFVDVHVHGGGGSSYLTTDQDEARRVFAFHRGHGTTTSMASLVTAPLEQTVQMIASLAALVADGRLAGIHLEGPFLSRARCGAHEPSLLRMPDAGTLRAMLEAGGGAVRMVTIAPELPGGVDLVKQTVDAGVIAAIGHTNATYREARTAIDAGASVATHLFNAMRGVHHREPGPVTAALEDESVTVELINDGVHLDPAVVELAFRVAGARRVALITDAMGAAGMGDGVYPLGPMTVRVRGGVAKLVDGDSIAGSTLTLDVALRRAVRVVGLPIVDAAAAVSTTPARLLGLGDRTGSLEPGKAADLVVLDEELEVVAVMAGGRWQGEVPS